MSPPAVASKLEQLVQKSSYAVLITDRQGRLQWCNEGFTRMCGYERSDLIGRVPGHLLQGPATDEVEVARIRDAIARGVGVTATLLNYHRDGRPYWVHLQIVPLADRNGELTHFASIERELTHDEAHDERKDLLVVELYRVLFETADRMPGGVSRGAA